MSRSEGHIAYSAAFAVGVGLHVFVFRIGEWDTETIRIFKAWALLEIVATVLLTLIYDRLSSPLEAIKDVAQLTAFGVFGIVSSMGIYRGFLHRLNRFPGPFLARFSNLYATALSAKKRHLYEEVEKLHGQYGDIVRLGPTELSIASPDALIAIHSPQAQCTKGPWYTVNSPSVSLHMCRNKAEHARRRRVWDRGFSSTALRDYEPRVEGYTHKLLDAIAQRSGKAMSMTDWFYFYSFDIMGDLSFGRPFGMLDNGQRHDFMNKLHRRMRVVGRFSRMMWIFPLLKQMPVVNRAYTQFSQSVAQLVTNRRKMTPKRPDVFSWLLEDFESKQKNASRQDHINLIGDGVLIAIAGSDTTAATLSCLFFELATNTEAYKKLQAEIDGHYSANHMFDSNSLSKLPYLEAVINEALRLHPAVPSGVQRVTRPDGLHVGKHYIPGNTIVHVPMFTVMRDPRNFERPADFVPERWTTERTMIKNASSFAPFSFGSYSCIGKQLALMEIRFVTASILQRFDFSFAPTQTKEAFLRGMEDTFTLRAGPLELVFQPRSR